MKNINQFQSVYSFLISPLFFFSGVFFPLKQMPPGLRQFAEFLPVSQGVALAQALFWGESPFWAFVVHGGMLVAFSLFFCTWSYYRIKGLLQH